MRHTAVNLAHLAAIIAVSDEERARRGVAGKNALTLLRVVKIIAALQVKGCLMLTSPAQERNCKRAPRRFTFSDSGLLTCMQPIQDKNITFVIWRASP